MTKVAITGAGGFLGFHVRAAALESGIQTVSIPVGESFDLDQAVEAINGADRLIHLAGVNRGTDQEVKDGNLLFAKQIAAALEKAEQPPVTVVYANSTQADNDSVYGNAKSHAQLQVELAASLSRSKFYDVRLPNLFGEYGRPFYNSVTATFCHILATGYEPEVHEDRELQLLHAQNAADILLGRVSEKQLANLSHWETVCGLKSMLEEFHATYTAGEIPDISTTFRRDLFNTYRSYTFPAQTPIDITRHADERGSFSEIIRSHGGTGQTSFSTTAPGVTRGDHYHRRKVERFTVLSGEAEICLRRLFDDEVFTFVVSGDEPKSVDMPTFYTHSIRNIGSEPLFTAFWTNDHFDPAQPDTIAESVK
jgi:UDP-2-acetamido-2,6-beta-L-arabino-hexul-4-ose reductase